MRFIRGNRDDSLRTATRDITLLQGFLPENKYRPVVKEGQDFHVLAKVNTRGDGKGLVSVTDHWGMLMGYVTTEEAENIRKEM